MECGWDLTMYIIVLAIVALLAYELGKRRQRHYYVSRTVHDVEDDVGGFLSSDVVFKRPDGGYIVDLRAPVTLEWPPDQSMVYWMPPLIPEQGRWVIPLERNGAIKIEVWGTTDFLGDIWYLGQPPLPGMGIGEEEIWG